jgi:hypothetical protein
MKVYESLYQVIFFDEDKKLLHKEWYIDTDTMPQDTFKIEVEKIAEIAEKYKPIRFHDDTTNFYFPISPKVQTWVNETIFPRFIKAGVMKYALIVSQELIAQLSIEQTMEESNAHKFQVKYFDDPEKAYEWLAL